MIKDTLQITSKKRFDNLFNGIQIKEPVWRYAWYFAGLPVVLITSMLFTWGNLNTSLQSLPMIALVAALYIAIWINRYQFANYRSYRAIGISVFYTTVGFLAVLAVLALFRLYYSRAFLFFAFNLTIIWMVFGRILYAPRNDKEYVVLKGGLADRLPNLPHLKQSYLWNLEDHKVLIKYDGIVVDLHAHDDNNRLLKALADSSLYGIPILHAASVFEKYSGRTNLDYIAKEGLYSLGKSRKYLMLKYLWEVGFILLFSPFILPLMTIVAIAIKLDSKGPVLFTQERIGKDGKAFTLYKFRSMRTDAEENGSQFASVDDNRITKLGKFIRKFRIDELPQFLNVIRGDMSLIGPRPEQKKFVERFNEEIPLYSYRHKVKPGISGWAQIKNGYAASLSGTKEKLEFDLYYLKNLSLSLDLLIVYATVKTVITGFGSR